MTEQFNQELWDERYRSQGQLWSGQPNPQLISEASALTPGRALDVGSGEGADAIWLAERGWRVTAVDISPVALQRGADAAEDRGPEVAARIEWLHADLIAWDPGPATFDLISAQFMHLPKEQREPLHARLAASVTPGGHLLIVAHHPSDLLTTMRRPQQPERFFTAEEVAATLTPSEWRVLVSAARPREAIDPAGAPVTIHDTVLFAQRRGTRQTTPGANPV